MGRRKGLLAVGLLMLGAMPLMADEAVSDEMFTVNNVWMMICTALVFMMHLGFACVETGFTQSKNTTNILFKNTAIISIGLLTYTLCGFNLMYPGTNEGGFFGFAGAFGFDYASAEAVAANETQAYNAGYTYWTDFLFQGMFAATAATIVSGAVAERIKLGSFLIFSVLFVAVLYPIVGMWHWGGGFLLKGMSGFWGVEGLEFIDFAGSTVVHSVGGWGALVCAAILGPRLGKYTENGIRPILGHSMPLGAIGVFLLWLGWFGFNGGSVLSAAAADTSKVLVTTNLAAAAGVLGAMVTTWFVFKKPDLGVVLNGSLAGLVGITAGAHLMSPSAAIIIGLVSGVLVVFSIQFFDKIKIDDPVGAISVHLVCGIWGTLAVAFFGNLGDISMVDQLKAQLTGIVLVGAATSLFAFIVFFLLKVTIGVRVSEKEELEGLDYHEHGAESYPDFVR